MVASSGYLWTPLRTLRQACRDASAAYFGYTPAGCETCGNQKLCEVNKRLERRRRNASGEVLRRHLRDPYGRARTGR